MERVFKRCDAEIWYLSQITPTHLHQHERVININLGDDCI